MKFSSIIQILTGTSDCLTGTSDWQVRGCASQIPLQMTGLEITADQRSMIGRKLFLIGEEATLPFILIGKKYI